MGKLVFQLTGGNRDDSFGPEGWIRAGTHYSQKSNNNAPLRERIRSTYVETFIRRATMHESQIARLFGLALGGLFAAVETELSGRRCANSNLDLSISDMGH